MQILFLVVLGVGVWSGQTNAQSVTNPPPGKGAISNLVFMIRQQPRSDQESAAKESAIMEAAKIHTPDDRIISALIDNSSYRARSQGRVSINPMSAPKFSVWPARDALLTIGEPVIPVLISKLKLQDADKLRMKHTLLLKEIAGNKSADLLRKAASESADETQKNRLKKCLAIIE